MKESKKNYRHDLISPPYWTLEEGLNFFSPIEEEGKRYPFRRIKTSKFKIIKQDIEIQELETFNSQEEIKQIVAYDPVADREKLKTQRSALRTANIKYRNMQLYGSIDKERKLNRSLILDEKIIFFCSNIRIKPEVLICYIINHLDLFSSDVEIPSKLALLIKDVQSSVKNNEGKSGKDKDNPKNQYTFQGKQINSWDQLEIVLVSFHEVRIKAQSETIKLSFQQLGMAHGQSPMNPKKVWYALIFFALANGKISSEDSSEIYLPNGKERSIEFNKHLNIFFNMNDSIYKNHYTVNHCWETKFKISSAIILPPDSSKPETISDLIKEGIEDMKRNCNISEAALHQS